MRAPFSTLLLSFCTGKPLGSHRLLPLTAARRRQRVLAREGGGGGGGVGGGDGGGHRGGKGGRLNRENLRLLIPGSVGQRILKYVQLNQAELTRVLDRTGAIGFKAADGRLSRRLEDVPASGDVLVVLQDDSTVATQLRSPQRMCDSYNRSRELEAFLCKLASTEDAGASVTMLQTGPFKGDCGEDFVQFDAAIQVDKVLYVGEYKRVLSEASVVDLYVKLMKIRAALTTGASPDLKAALRGVTHAKLFLFGEMVRPGLTVPKMVELAAVEGMSLVLPSGQALGLAASAAPAVQL